MSASLDEPTEHYFSTPPLKGLVQQLTHLAFFGDGLSVVIGPAGSGKSALAGELIGELEQAHQVVKLELEAEIELAEFIERMAAVLGIVDDGAQSVGQILVEVRHYIQALANDNKLAVLVIDDAHHLSEESLGALLSLLQGNVDENFGLHLVLLAKPGLAERIDALQILDVGVYDFDLPNFSPSELASFIEEKRPDEPSLSAAQLQRLWASSQGYPGLALSSLRSEVVTGAREPGSFWSAIPSAHIAAVAVLGAVLMWSVFFRQSGVEEQSLTLNPKLAPIDASRGKTDEGELLGVPSTGAKGREVAPIEAVKHELIESLPESNNVRGLEGVPENTRGSSVVLLPPQPALVTKDRDHEGQLNTRADADLVPSPPVTKTSDDDNPQRRSVADAKVATTTALAPSPTVKPASTSTLPPTNNLTPQELFILAQNPDAYALQVIAAGNKSSLGAYVGKQPNKSELKMYRSIRKGSPWFVVIEGVYTSREEALKAVKSLPSEQGKAGPWPRKFSSIHQEIETFRRN